MRGRGDRSPRPQRPLSFPYFLSLTQRKEMIQPIQFMIVPPFLWGLQLDWLRVEK